MLRIAELACRFKVGCGVVLLLLGSALADDTSYIEPIEYHRSPAMLPTGQETPAVIGTVAFSADGKWLASGDDAGRVVIREAGSEAIHQTCVAEAGAGVNGLQFLGRGELLASLHIDGKLNVWSTADGSRRQSLPADHYLSLAANPASGQLIAVTNEPALQTWSLSNDSKLPLIMASSTAIDAPFTLLSIDRAGKRLLLANSAQWQVWDATTVRKKLVATLPTAKLTAARMSPDGRTFATGDADGKVRVRDANVGGLLFSWQRHPNRVTSLAYSKSGKTIVSSCMKDRFRVWDLTLGEPTNDRAIALPAIHALEFSPEGRHLAAVGASESVCYLKSRRMTSEIAANWKPRMWNGKAAFAVKVPPGSQHAVVLGKSSTPQRVDLKSGEVTPGKPLTPSVRLLHGCLSRDGKLAAHAYPTGAMSIYDATDGQRLHLKYLGKRPSAMAISPNSKHLAIALRTELMVFDCETGEVALELPTIEPLSNITSIAWSADSNAFYLLGPDFEAIGREYTLAKWSLESGELLHSTTSPDMVGDVGISDDGMRLVTGGITGKVCVFDADLKPLNQFECGGRGGLHAFKIVDPRYLIVGTYKGSVLLVDMISGEELRRFEPLPPSKGMPVRAIDIDDENDHLIAVGGYDGSETMRIYSLKDLLD